MGNTTALYSNGVEIDTLLPWQSSAYNLSGSSGAFSLSSSAPVVASTICQAYAAPADLCEADRAWVYLGPAENRTSSVRIRNTGNTSDSLYLFRLMHADRVDGGLAKPPHWQHVALGMAHASGEERVWTTDSMWSAASIIAGGDVICSTSGNIHVSGDVDREHMQVVDPLTSCAHRFWSPLTMFAVSEVNITVPQGAHALNVVAMTESTSVMVTVTPVDEAGEVDLAINGWRTATVSNLTAGQRYSVRSSANIALSFECEDPRSSGQEEPKDSSQAVVIAVGGALLLIVLLFIGAFYFSKTPRSQEDSNTVAPPAVLRLPAEIEEHTLYRIFANLNTTGSDTVLTDQELASPINLAYLAEQLPDLWPYFDLDGDGKVTAEEVISALDADGSGSISAMEFIRGVQSLRAGAFQTSETNIDALLANTSIGQKKDEREAPEAPEARVIRTHRTNRRASAGEDDPTGKDFLRVVQHHHPKGPGSATGTTGLC